MDEYSLSPDCLVSEIGEQQLLQRLYRFCPAHLVGDDAAVLPTRGDRHLVVTSDMLVDGTHFSLGLANPAIRTTSPADAGWRAAAANLSDLAAMGADPLGITVSLGLPSETPVRWLDELYEGMTECLNCYHTPILGGDLCRSPILTLSITALGEVLPDRQILRSAARPGDAIVATGLHGASRAGLELLLHPEWGQDWSEETRQNFKRAHQRPTPRLDVPPLLRQIDPTVRVAGMDSSDGLADAVLQICRASGVGACLWQECLPVPDAFGTVLSAQDRLDWVLYGGEDFELVLCLPEAIARQLVRQLGGKAALIGEIATDPQVVLKDASGSQPDLKLSLDRGFQHFGDRPAG
ncbi:thiamine-phosphate kinase [Altericista sp. CCNU0014]|uniref:thiamine-phosphate kinase n=1 Tax=Altericista sp. CCNU0014 TaxID=3082949 RepID=UPI00384CC2F4